jgi:hypothetical protein
MKKSARGEDTSEDPARKVSLPSQVNLSGLTQVHYI